jgi:sortase A
MASGSLMLVDAGLTVVWQEPVTALIAKLRQGDLADDLGKLNAGGPTPLELEALLNIEGERQRIAFLARSLKRRAGDGDAVGRIRIPAIGLNKIVVDGTSTSALRRGPGIYDQTPFPGVPGTTAIAGHRTTYGAPFRNLDDVDRDDRIVVEMPYATFTYRVQRTRIVDPSAIEVIRRVGYDRLVLSACHPLFSAAKRLIVFARLERTEVASGARAGQRSYWTVVQDLVASFKRAGVTGR